MDITSRKVGDVLLLAVAGNITLGSGDTVVGDAIRAALGAGESKIVLDLRGVPHVDSFGVGELVAAYTSARRRGATLKLLKLGPRVRDLIGISGLDGVFEIFDDEAAAIASHD